MSGWYDVAQVCANGHVTNNAMKARPPGRSLGATDICYK